MSNEISEKEKAFKFYMMNGRCKDDYDEEDFYAGWDARNAIPSIDRKKLVEWLSLPPISSSQDEILGMVTNGEFDI